MCLQLNAQNTLNKYEEGEKEERTWSEPHSKWIFTELLPFEFQLNELLPNSDIIKIIQIFSFENKEEDEKNQ